MGAPTPWTNHPRGDGALLLWDGGTPGLARSGFWQGHLLHSATRNADGDGSADVPDAQPGYLSSWSGVSPTSMQPRLGVNLFAVICLGAIGLCFLTGRARIVFPAVVAGTIFCLADWVLIEDFGFFGGVGTDPNSMIPMALIFFAGYLALTRVPAVATETSPVIRLPQPGGRSRNA